MRESNVELLRIFAAIGVVVLHYNGLYGNAFGLVTPESINFYTLYILESVFSTSVNLFILISGYHLCMSLDRKLSKVVLIIVQVLFWNVSIYLVELLINYREFSFRTFARAMLPLNYYAVIYSALFLISPYLNRIFDRLSIKEMKRFILIIFSLFSVYPTAVDCLGVLFNANVDGMNTISLYGDLEGYTITNFCLVYCIGAYLRKAEVTVAKTKLMICISACVLLLTMWAIIIPNTAWSYCNPVLIIEAVCIFLLFLHIRLKNKYINCLAKAAFTCFLVHGVFVRGLNVAIAVSNSWIYMLCHLFGSAIAIYLLAYGMYHVFKLLEKVFLRRLLEKIDMMNIYN